jgi:hypothetical protein
LSGESFKKIAISPKEVTRLSRHLRVLRLLSSECDRWGIDMGLDAAIKKHRSLNRIRMIVGRRPEAEQLMSELKLIGAVIEHPVRNQVGELLFTYYDITPSGRAHERRVAGMLSSFMEVIDDVERTLHSREPKDHSP